MITDLHMPHVDGLAFARALRGLLLDVPVIASSGQFDDDSEAALTVLGVKWLLEKPFTEDQPTAMLRSALHLSPPSGQDDA